MRWLEFTQIILKLLGPATLHITAEIADLLEFGGCAAGSKEDGTPGDQELWFKAVDLGTKFIDHADNAVATYGRLGDIIVSDYAKLSVIGLHGGCDPVENPACPAYLALTHDDVDAASAAFYRGIERLAYETLVPMRFRIVQLSPYSNPPTSPPAVIRQGTGPSRPRCRGMSAAHCS